MSKSVVVNFGANALWQLHRFLQLCLRRFGGLVVVVVLGVGVRMVGELAG